MASWQNDSVFDSEISDTRMKLAVLKAKSKLSDDELFAQAEHDLDEVEQLEHYQNVPLRVALVPKIDTSSETKLMQTIQATFEQIFQALVLMLEDQSLFTVMPNEAEKLSRRSKEFEARLNRSVFEAKQQFTHYQFALSKYTAKPKDPNRKMELSKRFHSFLRCTYLILQSYLRHLPLSGGHVYPTSLFKFIDLCQSFIKSSKNINGDFSGLSQDFERLFNAAKAFEKKFEEAGKKAETGAKSPKVAKKAKKVRAKETKKHLDIINNLAREKFGSPIPKSKNQPGGSVKSGQSNHEASPALALKAKTLCEATTTSDQNNDSMTDKRPPSVDYFANTPESIREKSQVAEILLSNSKNSILKPGSGKNSAQMSKISIKDEEISIFSSLSSKAETVMSKSKQRQALHILEIDSEELDEITSQRQRQKLSDLKSWPKSLLHLNPVELVAKVADEVTCKILANVCSEAVDDQLIQKLIQAELIANH